MKQSEKGSTGEQLVSQHIESFNDINRGGLATAVAHIRPLEFALESGTRVKVSFTNPMINPPHVNTDIVLKSNKLYPSECRQRGLAYSGDLQIEVKWSIGDEEQDNLVMVLGSVPVMVKSELCNLCGLSATELIQRHEEEHELGGYFIVNGIERVMRMLVQTRRNCPVALVRPSWKNRGKTYTEFGVQMRCVKSDHSTSNITVHYLTTGTATVCILHRREQFFIPIILLLKALVPYTDKHIFNSITNGKDDDKFFKSCVANMLRQAQHESLINQVKVLSFMGKKFRGNVRLPEWYSDIEVCQYILDECVCIHLNNNDDKYEILVFMLCKLFALAKGKCAAESVDNPMNQEILLGGYLYIMVLKERLEKWLDRLKFGVLKVQKDKPSEFVLNTVLIRNVANKFCKGVISTMQYLIATGNLPSDSKLGLSQMAGLTIVADKLNYHRYISHFRAVHRGSYFTEMRVTSVRRLLPEAWGFMCPVHTPDGAPCGLLNHLTASCQIVTSNDSVRNVFEMLDCFGMLPIATDDDTPYQLAATMTPTRHTYPVLMDGKLMGYIKQKRALKFTNRIRSAKVNGEIPVHTEVTLVPMTTEGCQYPGVYIFTTPSRMVRPVHNIVMDSVEWIGSFEQVYLNIAVTEDEVNEMTTHREISQTSLLSVLAGMIPYSNLNQSPRNMYQCQMGKQTMGTPCLALPHRTDNKLFRLITPQSPIVKPSSHDENNFNSYPLGVNAIVAVVSYTGYDMEDAMVINKSALERGFFHGCIYKTEFVDLYLNSKKLGRDSCFKFATSVDDEGQQEPPTLDPDGLPYVGQLLQRGDPYYSYVDIATNELKIRKYQGTEDAFVDQVKILNVDGTIGRGQVQKVSITLRIPRNPIIGDKFSSRHGQKGICSQMWPTENMPFTESGLVPDIIFNPHGLPSRMTIGMMIETLAGKYAALSGRCQDATPFTFSEKECAYDHFGKQLVEAGYNYYGTESLYSGISGLEMEAAIFFGPIYYQRLRHMVSDKFQVRTTGPVDSLTHQPVHGRKRGGGVRFGEMERDALLAHGSSFLLQDRLLNCSDKTICHVCKRCGSILSPALESQKSDNAAVGGHTDRRTFCRICNRTDSIELITLPYVFKYLTAELSAMNIKVSLTVK